MDERNDAEVILVGNELLGGERGDRHLAFLGRALRPAGVRIVRAHTVRDHVGAIAGLVRERMRAARVLIVTGGLGPTDDDITRDGIAEAVGAPLEFDEPTWSRIVEFFAARGRTPSDANRRQAMFPRGAEIVGNALGTAPGFHVQHDGAHIFVLPGPPGELQARFSELVLPRVAAVFARPALRMEHFRTIGIGESQLVEMLKESVADLKGFTVSWLPNLFGVDIVLTQRPNASNEVMDAEANRLHER